MGEERRINKGNMGIFLTLKWIEADDDDIIICATVLSRVSLTPEYSIDY